jgi:hypothetical protein
MAEKQVALVIDRDENGLVNGSPDLAPGVVSRVQVHVGSASHDSVFEIIEGHSCQWTD